MYTPGSAHIVQTGYTRQLAGQAVENSIYPSAEIHFYPRQSARASVYHYLVMVMCRSALMDSANTGSNKTQHSSDRTRMASGSKLCPGRRPPHQPVYRAVHDMAAHTGLRLLKNDTEIIMTGNHVRNFKPTIFASKATDGTTFMGSPHYRQEPQ